MGLDNFASRTLEDLTLSDEDETAFEAAGIELCGGLCSDGTTSIRGKLYADVVLEVTGKSLYREWLPPEEVADMAAALARPTPAELADINDRARGRDNGTASPEEMANLQRFFAVCAERGLGLIAW